MKWTGELKWGLFRAPGGWCAAAWTNRGLSALVLPRKSRGEALRGLRDYLPAGIRAFLKGAAGGVPAKIQGQTRKALAGKPFHLSTFDISFMTPFQQRILRATCGIGRGETRSYAWVARKAGSPRGFRAAGQALTRNPVPLFIPCHRVIAGGDGLGGYGGGIGWKIRLLKNEGVAINRGIEGSYRVQKL